MGTKMLTWDELLASGMGAEVVTVSVIGAVARPREDGFGDPRTAVIEHYELIGDKVVIVTMDSLTGWHTGHVVAQGKDMPAESLFPVPTDRRDEPADGTDGLNKPEIEFDESFDGRDIRIDADGGLRIVGTKPVRTRDEAVKAARWLAGELGTRVLTSD